MQEYYYCNTVSGEDILPVEFTWFRYQFCCLKGHVVVKLQNVENNSVFKIMHLLHACAPIFLLSQTPQSEQPRADRWCGPLSGQVHL